MIKALQVLRIHLLELEKVSWIYFVFRFEFCSHEVRGQSKHSKSKKIIVVNLTNMIMDESDQLDAIASTSKTFLSIIIKTSPSRRMVRINFDDNLLCMLFTSSKYVTHPRRLFGILDVKLRNTVFQVPHEKIQSQHNKKKKKHISLLHHPKTSTTVNWYSFRYITFMWDSRKEKKQSISLI